MATNIKTHRAALAVGLACAGLATAAISMGWVWSFTTGNPYQPTWPLPGLYLVEAVVLPALVLWAVAGAHNRGASVGAWLAVGALAMLSLLGAMSIGLYVALSLIFLIPASIFGDDGRSRVSQKVAGFLIGSLLQAGVMFGVVLYFVSSSSPRHP